MKSFTKGPPAAAGLIGVCSGCIFYQKSRPLPRAWLDIRGMYHYQRVVRRRRTDQVIHPSRWDIKYYQKTLLSSKKDIEARRGGRPYGNNATTL